MQSSGIDISVIVPLYKGMKYISSIKKNMERCFKGLNYNVELIFINDYPLEKIDRELLYSEILEICYQENTVNLGIHRTRLVGLELSRGEYIHFLDQDDYVDDNFYQSQMGNIGNDDAIISMVYHGGKKYYEDLEKLTDYISIEWLIKYGNMIVSPGQVVIKKTSIPLKWKSVVLKHNGADDYFLWICMAHENKKIKFNYNTYFHHILNPGQNTSENTVEMFCSIQEVFRICKENYFDQNELALCWEREVDFIKSKYKKDRIQALLDKWMTLRDQNYSLASYFKNKGITQLSIYGMGMLGKHLYYELKGQLTIDFLFDRKIKEIDNKKIVNFELFPVEKKYIVVSVVDDNSALIERIKSKNNEVIELQKIISEYGCN